MRIHPIFWPACLLLCGTAHAATTLPPGQPDDVVERLPTITRVRPVAAAPALADPMAAATQARAHIATARQTGDTRYWGRAQAVLAPWWDKADAPVDLAVLQATVQQGRHEFKSARTVLQATLRRAPDHAQGWLNLAALERLSGQYTASLQACDAVARAGQNLYAQACQLETRSLQGQTAAARTGFTQLLATTQDPAQTSWLQSLLAESEERAGRDAEALRAYQRSLQAEPDLYTSIALADLLLRTGKTTQALAVLQPLPPTDAVLLRQATAMRRLNQPGWKPAHFRARRPPPAQASPNCWPPPRTRRKPAGCNPCWPKAKNALAAMPMPSAPTSAACRPSRICTPALPWPTYCFAPAKPRRRWPCCSRCRPPTPCCCARPPRCAA